MLEACYFPLYFAIATSGRHAAVARAAKSAATEGEAPAASDDTTAADVSESLMHSNKDFEL